MSQNPQIEKSSLIQESDRTYYYILDQDNMQGPYAASSLTKLLQEGKIKENSLIWSSLRDTWTPLEEVPELQLQLNLELLALAGSKKKSQDSLSGDFELPDFTFIGLQEEKSPQIHKKENPFIKLTTIARRKNAARELEKTKKIQEEKFVRTGSAESQSNRRTTLSQFIIQDPLVRGLILISGFVLIVFAFGNYKYSENSKLREWRNQQLISQKDYDRFLSIRDSDYQKDGIKVDFRISNSTSKILISSNLPDRSRLNVVISSVPGRVIGSYFFKIEGETTLDSGTAELNIEKLSEGSKIPAGEYQATFICLNCEPNSVSAKPLVSNQEIFLLGTKAETFTQDLEGFQISARKRIQDELDEIRQLISTVSQQLDETMTSYGTISTKSAGKSQIKASIQDWQTFSDQWLTLQNSLIATLNRYDLRAEGPLFHHSLYERVLEAMKLSSKLHEKQGANIRSKVSTDNRELQDLEQLIHHQLTGVWAKLTRAQQDLANSTQLPSRPD